MLWVVETDPHSFGKVWDIACLHSRLLELLKLHKKIVWSCPSLVKTPWINTVGCERIIIRGPAIMEALRNVLYVAGERLLPDVLVSFLCTEMQGTWFWCNWTEHWLYSSSRRGLAAPYSQYQECRSEGWAWAWHWVCQWCYDFEYLVNGKMSLTCIFDFHCNGLVKQAGIFSQFYISRNFLGHQLTVRQ